MKEIYMKEDIVQQKQTDIGVFLPIYAKEYVIGFKQGVKEVIEENRNRVMKKYEEEAAKQARIELLAQLVEDKQLDEAIAAEKLDVSVEAFRDMAQKIKK